ncbi:hypothetical protein DOTSEDRAFT_70914 [Dothistroma septosporum NZE10]|uniref:Uncharacterized protein n=1 Tax=Dothistroma septosporum (strain NZE10 / CBS 128990) TaxID=675120 RepID=N1PQ20_DOTSN|nr:hypothetical protein DOTSEDRAFT_70914 [Dothistroma septosporum NZE10]
MPTPRAIFKAQERLYQPTQRSCSAWEIETIEIMLKRAFRYGHTDFSDLRPIGRLLARCDGSLSFKLEKVYPSGCKVLQRMYSRTTEREDEMATLIPPVEVPALIARPDAAATTTGSTSWFVVGIEGPPWKGKPGLRSQIKLGIAGEITDHRQVAGLAPAFRVCCVSRRQVKGTEWSLRQNERQLGASSTEFDMNSSTESQPHRQVGLDAQIVRSVVKSDVGSVESLNELLSMYTER